jgi:hypothetical protein
MYAHFCGRVSLTGIFKEEMVRRHISIPESLDDDMRDFISTTYHRYEKGGYSSLVIEAVRAYIDPGTHTQKRNFKKYTNHKYDALMAQIKIFLVPSRYPEFTKIHEKHLNEAIAEVMSVIDNRSIKNWRRKLESGGYIERTGFGEKTFKILKEDNESQLEETIIEKEELE